MVQYIWNQSFEYAEELQREIYRTLGDSKSRELALRYQKVRRNHTQSI